MRFRHPLVILALIGLFLAAAVVLGTPVGGEQAAVVPGGGRALALAERLSIGHAGLEPPSQPRRIPASTAI